MELADNIQGFLSELDEKSRAIIWRLWINNHADINELSRAAGLKNHMDVLLRIREIINPIAISFFGREVMEFIPQRIDPWTGEKVLFNWWVNKEILNSSDNKRPFVDLFNNEEEIEVIVEIVEDAVLLPVEVKIKNGFLDIKIKKVKKNYVNERELTGAN